MFSLRPFGFQPQRGKAEAIFSLSTIINMSLQKKKGWYSLRKDLIRWNESNFGKQLRNFGIRGKLLSIKGVMYEDMKCCVKSAGKLSEFFKNNIGPLQGEVLSPILFSWYVNDFEMEFLRRNVPIYMQELNLFVLMYADDMVIFSESVHELKEMFKTFICLYFYMGSC